MQERVVPETTFCFLISCKEFELTVLTFVRSIRTSDFPLYVDCLKYLCIWFFALDITHYARWLPVHIRDLISLESLHADIFQAVMQGKFTVKKSTRPFSAISFDQSHEQLNRPVKDDGGAIGLTENDGALRRWVTCGPEIAHLIAEL